MDTLISFHALADSHTHSLAYIQTSFFHSCSLISLIHALIQVNGRFPRVQPGAVRNGPARTVQRRHHGVCMQCAGVFTRVTVNDVVAYVSLCRVSCVVCVQCSAKRCRQWTCSSCTMASRLCNACSVQVCNTRVRDACCVNVFCASLSISHSYSHSQSHSLTCTHSRSH